MKQTKTIGKRILKLLLVLALCVFTAGCAEDGSAPVKPVIYSPKADQTLTVYEGENTILEIVMAANATGETPTSDNRGYSFQWYRDGEQIKGAMGPVYELEDADMSDNGTVFHCTVGNMVTTITSHTFTIKVVPVLSDPIEDITKPTPTPKPATNPTPTPTQHAHKWEPVWKEQDVYITVNVYGYKCNTCDFTTTSEADMRTHLDANAGTGGHADFESDVVIGYFYEVYSCKCGWEGLNSDALATHLAEEYHKIITETNPETDEPIERCSVENCDRTDGEHTYRSQFIHTSPDETVTPTEVDITDIENLVFESGNLKYYNLKIYKCPDCWIQTVSTDGMKKHFNNNADNDVIVEEVVEDVTTYKCVSCDASFSDQTEAMTHAGEHKTNQDWNFEKFSSVVQLEDIYMDAGFKCTAEGCEFITAVEAEMTAHTRETTVGAHTCDFNQVLINSYQQYDGKIRVDTGLVTCAGCGQQRQRG